MCFIKFSAPKPSDLTPSEMGVTCLTKHFLNTYSHVSLCAAVIRGFSLGMSSSPSKIGRGNGTFSDFFAGQKSALRVSVRGSSRPAYEAYMASATGVR